MIKVIINFIYFFLCFFLINNLIDSKLKCIINHSRYQLCQQCTRGLDTWILVNFYQPYFILLIYKIIQSKYLKTVTSIIVVNFFFNRTKRHIGNLFNFVPYFINLTLLHKLFQSSKRHLIPILILPVIL